MVTPRLKIAIVGTGIAGNYAAWRLARDHDITVFEADSRIGGHSNTVNVEDRGRQCAVDTGFIVYNDKTYPNFLGLLDELGVESKPSAMSFSVRCERSGLEYNGASLNTLFAQRCNLVRPSFWRMLSDILRFNRDAPALLERPGAEITLHDFLVSNGYSRAFIDHYIVPMGAAIWSAAPGGMGGVPAGFFVRFFHNHGLLSISERPTWRVIRGGSQRYVEKLVAGHRDRIRLKAPVQDILRYPDHVLVKASGLPAERFDKVVIAAHSDQALSMLSDATAAEREVLGSIPYQANEAVLHTDESLMPNRTRAWAAWNYHVPAIREEDDRRVALTYNMNILQSLDVEKQTGYRPDGPIRLLTHLRYFGYVFNPVSFYYCFDPTDQALEAIVAEVNNTPWGERHCYVLEAAAASNERSRENGMLRFGPEKAMHVSPFMPMDVSYDWCFGTPGDQLNVHMINLNEERRIFDATLRLRHRELTPASLRRVLFRFPVMTLKVITAIHWQALRLWLKGCPVYDHPAKNHETGQLLKERGQ